MKTLDEVIKSFEWCLDDNHVDNCDGCPYETGEMTDCHIRNNDALFYLKEYRWVVENCAEALAEKYPSENVPLTWDELKTMEGKPVWIEFLNDKGEWNGEWCLVESSNDILCEILRCKITWWGLRKITLGKTWQAYRREKK